MLLASYKSTRPGLQGVANIAIRIRLRGLYSHSEIVFEPGDGVGHLMPDGTCDAGQDGSLWSVSSVAAERLPAWSRQRPGRIGGVRFKRIAFDKDRWDLVPVHRNPLEAATRAKAYEGAPYDWRLIVGYVSWLMPGSSTAWCCHEIAGYMLGIPNPHRLDPCSLHDVVQWSA